MSGPVVNRPDQDVMPQGVLRRRRVLWLLGGGAAAVTVAGLGGARFVRSPAQRVAETAPPPRTTLTVEVELRVLADTVVMRGLVSAGTTVEVSPLATEAQRLVVTGVRMEPGQQFDAGTVLVEVSGRPLFALAGEVPAYRDLRPGMRGRDVAQLQEALAALGYATGDPDGELGPATKAALAVFYEDLGYEPRTAGEPGALTAANDAVRLAERELDAAEDALAALQEAPPTPVPGEPDPMTQARQRVEFAREDLASAEEERDEVARTTGAMLPLSEVVFLPEFPARVEQSTARVGLDLAAGEPGGVLLILSSGALVVRAGLNPAQRELLAEGMPVEIGSEVAGITAAGEIASIGELAADGSGVRSHPMVVVPTEGPLDEGLAGADVRLTVEAATTAEEVLVVPLSAVFAGADGRVAVLRADPDGSRTRVTVAPGVSGDGYVAVEPVDGELQPGDQVVVGAAAGPDEGGRS